MFFSRTKKESNQNQRVGNIKRIVLVHCHLFKNAGTSLDWSLCNFFGDDFLDHRDDDNMIRGAEYLGPFLEENSNLKAISSHHIRFPLPQLSNTILFPILMFRNPIDRVGSVYSFERHQDAHTPGAINAKKMSFPEYVLWRMKPTVKDTIRNFQTRSCLDCVPSLITEADFNFALNRIQGLPMIGIVENYDESMILFEEFLRPFFPKIDLSYIKKNVNEGRELNIEKRLNKIFVDLGFDVYSQMLVNNHWDLMLYLEAKKIIKKRFHLLENHTKQMGEFKKRCNVLY